MDFEVWVELYYLLYVSYERQIVRRSESVYDKGDERDRKGSIVDSQLQTRLKDVWWVWSREDSSEETGWVVSINDESRYYFVPYKKTLKNKYIVEIKILRLRNSWAWNTETLQTLDIKDYVSTVGFGRQLILSIGLTSFLLYWQKL